MTYTEQHHTPAASRCITLIRPHRWTRWKVVQGTVKGVFVSGPAALQTRTCMRCGRTQLEDL